MTHRTAIRSALLLAVVIGAWQLSACGGRVRTYREVQDEDDDVVAGSSSAGRAGSVSGRAGNTAAGGAAPTAGSGNAGATNVCPPCPAIGCGPGTHPEFLPGQCCPVCVDDPMTTCEDGRKAYQADKAGLLRKYQFGCKLDSECAVIGLNNSCEQCAYTAVWASVAGSYQENANGFAQNYCAACPPQQEIPCVPPPPAVCTNNVCSLAIK